MSGNAEAEAEGWSGGAAEQAQENKPVEDNRQGCPERMSSAKALIPILAALMLLIGLTALAALPSDDELEGSPGRRDDGPTQCWTLEATFCLRMLAATGTCPIAHGCRHTVEEDHAHAAAGCICAALVTGDEVPAAAGGEEAGGRGTGVVDGVFCMLSLGLTGFTVFAMASQRKAVAPAHQSSEEHEQEEEDQRGAFEKITALVQEYREKVALMPIRYKLLWAVVLLLWAPLAYTVLAVVPGSMMLFLVAWTTIVLKMSGNAEDGEEEEEQSVGGGQGDSGGNGVASGGAAVDTTAKPQPQLTPTGDTAHVQQPPHTMAAVATSGNGGSGGTAVTVAKDTGVVLVDNPAAGAFLVQDDEFDL